MKHRRTVPAFAHWLVGGALFGLALMTGLAAMGDARQQEELHLLVEPGSVAPWRGSVMPPELRSRVEVDPVLDNEDRPGVHFARVFLSRRGGRTQEIVDPVVVGPFAKRWAKGSECAARLTVSGRALRAALLPVLDEELMPLLRNNPLLGPDARVERAEIVLVDGGARFDLAVSGRNTVGARGTLGVELSGPRKVRLQLETLDSVEFRGALRKSADEMGAGAGAWLGGSLGAAAGYLMVDRFVDRKAKQIVRREIETGLARASNLELVPAQIVLIADEPRSAVELSFCEGLGVDRGGIRLGVGVQPVRGETTPGFEAPGPVQHHVELPDEELRPSTDLRFDLSGDAVNVILDAWTANGLLADRLEPGLLHRANEALAEWTTLRLLALEPRLPPIVGLDSGSTPTEAGPEIMEPVSLGNLEILVEDEARSEVRLRVNATGMLGAKYDPERGVVGLTAALEHLWVSCVSEAERSGQLRLRACYGPLLKASDVKVGLDRELRAALEGLPGISVHELLAKLRLRTENLDLSRPSPGVLRISAAVETQGSP